MTLSAKKIFFSVIVWLLLVVVLTSSRPKHEYHVSVTQMRYNPAQKNLEISVRTYTDDLEKGLSLANDNRRFVLRNDDANNPFVERYLRKHFVLADPSRQIRSFTYIGKEEEADGTWLYLEVPFSGNPEGWVLKNDLLMETFDDQVNMVNIKWGDERKTYMFKSGKPVQAL